MKLRLLALWLAFSDKVQPTINNMRNAAFDLFQRPKLVMVKFKYLEQYKKQNPIMKEHIVLAKVRRNATASELAEIFNLDASPKVTYTIKDVKVLPITKLPRV